MAIVTPNMGLDSWNSVSDLFSYTQLANNWTDIDNHDHTSGKGVQIPTAGIQNLAVDSTKLSSNAVTTAKITDLNITTVKIADSNVTYAKLAADVNKYLPTAPVSALPGSPVDGQEIYYQDAAMATAGIVWHLRYRLAGGTYKWGLVGGAPLLDESLGTSTSPLNTAGAWTAILPGVDTPSLAAPPTSPHLYVPPASR